MRRGGEHVLGHQRQRRAGEVGERHRRRAAPPGELEGVDHVRRRAGVRDPEGDVARTEERGRGEHHVRVRPGLHQPADPVELLLQVEPHHGARAHAVDVDPGRPVDGLDHPGEHLDVELADGVLHRPRVGVRHLADQGGDVLVRRDVAGDEVAVRGPRRLPRQRQPQRRVPRQADRPAEPAHRGLRDADRRGELADRQVRAVGGVFDEVAGHRPRRRRQRRQQGAHPDEQVRGGTGGGHGSILAPAGGTSGRAGAATTPGTSVPLSRWCRRRPVRSGRVLRVPRRRSSTAGGGGTATAPPGGSCFRDSGRS